MTVTDSQNYCARQVRLHDPDRYMAALFAPDDRRPALLALYAFNIEVATVREMVSEPTLGRMRLQWWRETIADIESGRVDAHAIAPALGEAMARHDLSRAAFDRLIDGREFDLSDEPPADLAALETYVEETASTLTILALAALGHADDAAAETGRRAGLAFGLTGLLRAVPFHARQRRLYLCRDLMRAAGIGPEDVFAMRPAAGIADVTKRIALAAHQHLDAARAARLPRSGIAAVLPLVLAEGDLHRLARAKHDVFGSGGVPGRLARQIRLARAAWRGRI